MEDFDPRTWTNIPTWRANLEMRFTENLEDFAGLELDDLMDALINHAYKAVESENPLATDLAEAFFFEVDWQNIAYTILDMLDVKQTIGANKGVVTMEKFKVKKKHLTGKIADFPKRVVQAMVDEQVRQGNPADPRVFARERAAGKDEGGFTWIESALGENYWADVIRGEKFHLIPKREKPIIAPEMAGGQNSDERVEPHAIIQHMLAKGMDVWVCMSDDSYEAARVKIGRYAYRIARYDADNNYPVRGRGVGWKYAVPINTATMTEITEVPKYDNQ